MKFYLTIFQAWQAISTFPREVSYDVNMRQWGQALPCIFFHEEGNPCNQLTGFVDITEEQAIILCKRHNARLVTIDRGDIGDDDRRDIVLIVCQGPITLTFANTFADAKAWAAQNGYTIKR